MLMSGVGESLPLTLKKYAYGQCPLIFVISKEIKILDFNDNL